MTAATTWRDMQADGGTAVRSYRPQERLSAPWARLVDRLSRQRAPFDGWIDDLPLRLGIDRICLGEAPSLPDSVEIGFSLADRTRFRLKVPDHLIGQIAESVQPGLSAPLSEPTDALLLELALASLLNAAETILGQAVTIDGVGRAEVVPGSAILVLAATLAEETVPLHVDLGPAADPPELDRLAALLRLAESAPLCPGSVEDLPVSLAFVAGSTRLTLAELDGLVPGDAVLPDIWHPARGELVVTLTERFATQAAIDRGTARLKGPFRQVMDDPAEAEKAGRGAGMAEEAERLDESGEDAGSLDALTVTLTFELARRTVQLGDLKTMGAGHVFDLGLDPEDAVELRANGVRIGRGEIVEIGERLGVRVLRLFDRGQAS